MHTKRKVVADFTKELWIQQVTVAQLVYELTARVAFQLENKINSHSS